MGFNSGFKGLIVVEVKCLLCTQICLFLQWRPKREHRSHCVFSVVQITTPLCNK